VHGHRLVQVHAAASPLVPLPQREAQVAQAARVTDVVRRRCARGKARERHRLGQVGQRAGALEPGPQHHAQRGHDRGPVRVRAARGRRGGPVRGHRLVQVRQRAGPLVAQAQQQPQVGQGRRPVHRQADRRRLHHRLGDGQRLGQPPRVRAPLGRPDQPHRPPVQRSELPRLQLAALSVTARPVTATIAWHRAGASWRGRGHQPAKSRRDGRGLPGRRTVQQHRAALVQVRDRLDRLGVQGRAGHLGHQGRGLGQRFRGENRLPVQRDGEQPDPGQQRAHQLIPGKRGHRPLS